MKKIIFLTIITAILAFFYLPSEVKCKSYDPCELIKTSDIQAFFPDKQANITKHDTKPVNPLGQKICYWSLSDTDMFFVQLSISSDDDAKAMKVNKQFENNKQFIDGVKTIEGLGDSAYYGGSGLKLGAGLHVLLKDKGIMFNIMIGLGRGNNDQQKHIDIEKKLAQKIIEGLK